jgi:hypothetical protein
MADTPLGKGLIEIGANLAPLEVGLTTAQARVQEYLTAISAGLDPSKPRDFANAMKVGESSLRESATQAALIAANIERSTNAVRAFQAAAKKQAQDTASAAQAAAAPLALPAGGADRVKDQTQTIKQQTQAMQDASVATNTAATSKAKAAEQTMGLGKRISESTKGVREFAASITGIAGVFTGLIGVVTLVIGGLTALYAKFTKGREEALALEKSINELRSSVNEMKKIGEGGATSILGLDESATTKQIRQVENFYTDLQTRQAELFYKEEERINKSDKSKKAKATELARLNDKLRQDTASAEIKKNEELDKLYKDAAKNRIEEVNAFERENLLRQAQASGDERKVIDMKAAEEKRKVNDQIAKEENDYVKGLLTQRLQVIEAERLAEHKKINEREQAEKDAAKKIADEKRQAEERAAKAFAEAQRAAFGQLQNQINSLFNTGNMEVGINRVAGLIQVLIDKTERG